MTAATDLALFILKPPRFSLHRFVIYLQFDFVATALFLLRMYYIRDDITRSI